MTTKSIDAQNFLDIKGLNSIRLQSKTGDEAGKEEALQAAAKQFESIFMQMLLKSMRKAQEVLESDSPFNSESSKFYRDMHDQQMSIELSNNGSLGLSELIVRQLGGDSENFTPHTILRSDGNLDSRNTAAKSSAEGMNLGSISGIRSAKNQSDDPQEQPEKHFASMLVKPQQSFHAESINEPQEEGDLIKAIVNDTPTFNEPQDFVNALLEPAKAVEKRLNIPFEVVIAQAALETGWGQKIIKTSDGQSSHNLFNIKADTRWQGDKTHKETLEYEQGSMVKKKEPFRVYSSMAESLNDYMNFLSTGERYKSALEKVNNVDQFLQGLQSAGYATDPKYADKIMGTLKTVTSLLGK